MSSFLPIYMACMYAGECVSTRPVVLCPSPTISLNQPTHPPFKSSTSSPGLFTSNDRITMRRGLEVKSRGGTGMRLTRYSQTTSMLNFFTCWFRWVRRRGGGERRWININDWGSIEPI